MESSSPHASTSLPPGPSHWSTLRLALAAQRDPLRVFLDLARDHGDVVHARLGPWHFILLSHPDVVEEVLIKHPRAFTKERGPARQIVGNGLLVSEGEFHKRERRLLQPAFHRDRIARYGAVMTDLSRRRCDRWHAGAQLKVRQEMMQLTQMIAAKAMFSTDVEAEADALGKAIATTLNASFLTQQLPFPGLVKVLRRRSVRRYEEALGTIDRTIYRMIKEHRRSGQDHGDILSVLLQAQDTEGGTGGLTDEQVRDELATLFVAGHETTANALTWTWYLLARHPEAEMALHAELDQVLGGRAPTVADVPQLRYTEMLVAEVMRLYPPGWTLIRQAVAETVVGGYTVPAGAFVFISIYGIHHDARFFPDPWRFDPQRMTREARAARAPFVYLPFGRGGRQCMGEPFAWLELVLVVATLAQRWRLRLAPGRTVTPSAGVTLRPKGDVLMIVEPRT
jgi:cytochrome P450